MCCIDRPVSQLYFSGAVKAAFRTRAILPGGTQQSATVWPPFAETQIQNAARNAALFSNWEER